MIVIVINTSTVTIITMLNGRIYWSGFQGCGVWGCGVLSPYVMVKPIIAVLLLNNILLSNTTSSNITSLNSEHWVALLAAPEHMSFAGAAIMGV